ncbi:RT0821/Lpp0805 family surface protein [Zhengella mangrovi]|uniref:RT0821/Lpp0805 family surface protein n=1 Tax=Zhengella mangrovi TaxID=1982044 RepID=UPI000C075A04|nr:RT0821/Lpp0805 family surface protein [Zhengella mangrovi]
MRLLPFLILLPAIALAGCATSGNTRTAFAPLALQSRGAAAVEKNLLAPLGGGLVAQSDALKPGTDNERRAVEAEYRALEYSRGGETVEWKGSSGVSGAVTPAQPYQVGSQNCRQYAHALTVSGQVSEYRGAACRNPDGSWTLLN